MIVKIEVTDTSWLNDKKGQPTILFCEVTKTFETGFFLWKKRVQTLSFYKGSGTIWVDCETGEEPIRSVRLELERVYNIEEWRTEAEYRKELAP